MITETVVSRIIAAIDFQDSILERRLGARLKVRVPGCALTVNNSGVWIVWSAPGFEEYAGAFDTIPAVPPTPLRGEVEDPAGVYFSRSFEFTAPLADPGKPVIVKMLPAAAVPIEAGWAVARVLVKRSGTNAEVEGAYVRVVRAGKAFLGMTGKRGEAVVPVTGVPPVAPAAGNANLFTRKFAAELQAFAEPKFAPSRNPDAFDAARADLLKSAAVPVELSAGQQIYQEIVI